MAAYRDEGGKKRGEEVGKEGDDDEETGWGETEDPSSSEGVEEEDKGDATGDRTGSSLARRASMQKLVE